MVFQIPLTRACARAQTLQELYHNLSALPRNSKNHVIYFFLENWSESFCFRIMSSFWFKEIYLNLFLYLGMSGITRVREVSQNVLCPNLEQFRFFFQFEVVSRSSRKEKRNRDFGCIENVVVA